mgnify:CR=1 FL=1
MVNLTQHSPVGCSSRVIGLVEGAGGGWTGTPGSPAAPNTPSAPTGRGDVGPGAPGPAREVDVDVGLALLGVAADGDAGVAAVAGRDSVTACRTLADLGSQLRAQAGKKLPAATAALSISEVVAATHSAPSRRTVATSSFDSALTTLAPTP